MKALTKQRIISPILGLIPLVIYLACAIVFEIFVDIDSLYDSFIDKYGENKAMICADTISAFVEVIATLVGCFAAYKIIYKRNKLKLLDAINIKKIDIKTALMTVCLQYLAVAVIIEISGYVLSKFMSIEENDTNYSARAIVLLFTVIIGPIAEEILCRFGIIEGLRGAYPMMVICIANGVIFSVPHLYNIQGSLDVFICGFVYAYVYCKTHNLVYSTISHIINNALCYLPVGIPGHYENGFVVCDYWWYVVMEVVLLVLCLIWFVKVFNKKYTDNYFEVNYETGLPCNNDIDSIEEDTV